MAIRAVSLGLLALASLAGSACLGHERPPSMGFEPAASGFAILYKPCHAETVIKLIEVYDARSTASNAADDRLLWANASPQGSLARRFDYGQPADGFEIVTQPRRLPDGSALLRVRVTTGELPDGESVAFHRGDLRPGQVLVDGGYESREKFFSRDSCG